MRKKKLESYRLVIKMFTSENNDFLKLYGIYKATIDPELDYENFVRLYINNKLVSIDLTMYTFENEIAGFSAAFFYAGVVKGKKSFIARSATGLKKEYQGQGLHNKSDLYFKFIKFAAIHPFKPLWITALVINAFVYADLCRFVPKFFPQPEKQVPADVETIMNDVIVGSDHSRNEMHPYAVEVPIQVKFNEDLLRRIYTSPNSNVKWYLKENPLFLDKHGLMVVISVSCKNISGTLLNMMMNLFSKKTYASNPS